MAASSVAMDNGNIPPPENWDRQQPRDSIMHAPGDSHPANGAALDDEHRIDDDTHVTSQQPPDAPPLPETNGNSGPKSVEATAKGEKLIKVLVWSLCTLSIPLLACLLLHRRSYACTVYAQS